MLARLQAFFTSAQARTMSGVDAVPREGEVRARPFGVCAPVRLGRDRDAPQEILFHSVFHRPPVLVLPRSQKQRSRSPALIRPW